MKFAGFFKRLIRILRSQILSIKIDGGNGRFVICDHNLPIHIKKAKNAKIHIHGRCMFNSWLGGKIPVNIILKENAKLTILGDFAIGHGVGIMVDENAELIIGGKEQESGSGITCDSKIMVRRKVEIGRDFICAWNVFITDSDWHQIDGQNHSRPVVIGDHVWVGNNCSILNGTFIENGSIVASHSKLVGKKYPKNSLIGGVPAKVLKRTVTWHRDI